MAAHLSLGCHLVLIWVALDCLSIVARLFLGCLWFCHFVVIWWFPIRLSSCHLFATYLSLVYHLMRACHLAVTWLALGWHLAVTWLSLCWHLAGAWLSLGWHLAVTCLLFTCHSAVTWLPPVCHLPVIRLSLSWLMFVIWLAIGCYLSVAWFLLACHFFYNSVAVCLSLGCFSLVIWNMNLHLAQYLMSNNTATACQWYVSIPFIFSIARLKIRPKITGNNVCVPLHCCTKYI